MSVSKMSAAIRSHIVSRLKDVIETRSGGEVTQRKLSAFEEYTSRKQIRSDTDTVGGRHESIMSRQSFENLLKDLNEAVQQGDLSNQLSQAVATISFDGFVSYISEVYYKDKEFLLSDNRRVKGGFVYSGPTRETTQSVAVFAKAVDTDESYKDVLLLKNIPQGKLVEYYVEYIAANTPGITPQIKADLKKSLQGGHLTGVFTARLIRAFNLQKDATGQVKLRGSNTAQLTQLEQQLAAIVDLVTDADFLSSNVVLDVNLFTQTDKRLYSNSAELRMTTEVQFAKQNKEAGDMLTTAGTYLSKLIASIKPNVSQAGQETAAQLAFEKMLLNLKNVSQYVKDRATQLQALDKTTKLDPKLQQKLVQIINNQQTFATLIKTEGSRSILDHIGDIVALTIAGKDLPRRSQTTVKTKDLLNLAKPKAKQKVAKPVGKKQTLKTKSPKIKVIPVSETPLTSLQALLNSRLVETIRKNMGGGDRKDILNLRTGRFAESARVERLTQGREGMITAYYNYMRYPYATFSQGGRQEFPRSRDPKLLISKSIREILQEQMITRMRAVLA